MIYEAYTRMGREGRWRFIGRIEFSAAGALPFKKPPPIATGRQHTPRNCWYKLVPTYGAFPPNTSAIADRKSPPEGNSRPDPAAISSDRVI